MATIDSLDIRISVSAQNASKALRELSKNLNNFGQQLKGIGSGSGLSKINSDLAKISQASKSMSDAVGNSFKKITKQFLSFKAVVRGVEKAWSSVQISMDFVEISNYFNKAFEQVAEKADLSSFQQLGYDSAEEYAKSFSERARKLTATMTGFEVTDKGTLVETGMPSLGLNPSELMNYQAMFAQMSSSMDIASETSLKLSGALTKIGADLASVKNLDFKSVWNDMASGLAGMSRTLDKYGVNIRTVNLQQKLTELGINANITALNQNDKALLRTIILLDSVKYSWGDLAETIDNSNKLLLVA